MVRIGACLCIALASMLCAPVTRAAEIHDAVRLGDLERVTRLLAADPTLVGLPTEDAARDLPLHVAARAGRIEIAQRLLEAGAALEGFDSDESTPLHVALAFRRPAMVRFLLERGADVNRRDRHGSYALSFAVGSRDTTCVRLVLQAGADLHYRSSRGATLLHLACRSGVWDVAERALRLVGDIDVRDGAGATPLHHVAAVDDSARVARVIAMGASVEAADTSGLKPLMMALMRGARGAVNALLAAGADARTPDRHGWSPLDFAVRNSDLGLARRLLQHGADAARPDTGAWSRAGMAVESQNAELVTLLLDHGMRVDRVEVETGRGPLHTAAVSGRADVVEALLAHGADANARDRAGLTPLDLARRYGHRGVERALMARGGSGAAMRDVPAGTLATSGRVGRGEAAVWYLGHSGWAVKTRSHFLVFDYCRSGFTGAPGPDEPGLVNGHIAPAELRGERVTVFASHEHADHFDRGIFDWRGRLPGITYVLGFAPDSAPPHVNLAPRETREIDGMRVTTFRSNDSGVGFVVEVDGLVLLHAGDHANRRRDLSGDYTPEIEFVRARGLRPDIAFLPISGCNFGDHVAVEIGAEYTLRTLEPAMFLPMHGGFTDCRYGPANAECARRFPGVQTATVENRGDHLRYRRARRG